MTDRVESWVIERGPITDPEYLRITTTLVTRSGRPEEVWVEDPEAATRFSTPELATQAAAETRVDALRVVSDVDL